MRGKISGGRNDRDRHARGTQLLDHFNAGHSGHFVIGDDEVVSVRLKRVPASGAILDTFNVVAGSNQHIEGKSAGVPVVINHENAVRGIHRAWHWCAGWLSHSRLSVIFHSKMNNNVETGLRPPRDFPHWKKRLDLVEVFI
jgi:hypothetical protein